MNGCTAPHQGHERDSQKEFDCPVHGAAARRRGSPTPNRVGDLAAPQLGAVRGRSEIAALIAARKLELVEPDVQLALMQLDQARESLDLAAEQSERRPEAALTLAYDAARKVVAAMLEAQGLRARMPHAHVNVQEALRGQWGDSLADRFDSARKERNLAEYPSKSTTRTTVESASLVVALAEELFHLADEQILSLPRFPR